MDNWKRFQHRDLRRHRRVATNTRATAYWEGPNGQLSFAQAHCVDVSEAGICVQISGEVPQRGTSMHVSLEETGYSGYCIVRHSQPRGIVGAEFRFELAELQELERWRRIAREAENRRSVRDQLQGVIDKSVGITSTAAGEANAPGGPMGNGSRASCRYCGRPLKIRQRLLQAEFCGDAHRRTFRLERFERVLNEA
jgi:hypothetical protein